MKLYVTYGFYLTLAGAIFTLAMFALGYHTVENLRTGQLLGWVMLPVMVAILAFGIRAWRNEVGNGAMSYGRGLGTGLLITLWSSLFSIVFQVLYFKVINPGYSEAIYQFQISEMERKGMSADIISKAEPMMRFMMSTPMMIVMALIFSIFFGFVVSLILAAIFKSEGNPASVPPPPPVQA